MYVRAENRSVERVGEEKKTRDKRKRNGQGRAFSRERGRGKGAWTVRKKFLEEPRYDEDL